MNDFSQIPAESEFRNEMTVQSQEVQPDAHLEMEYEDRFQIDDEETVEPDESMDGDFDSGMASAGYGTDEDYEHETPLGEEYGGE